MKKTILPMLTSSANWILTITQTNEIFQLIELILAIISSLLTLLYILYRWYKKASEDGNISPEEVKELIEELDEYKRKEKEQNGR